jgi:tetratricopeptide (TPR) repeat protein
MSCHIDKLTLSVNKNLLFIFLLLFIKNATGQDNNFYEQGLALEKEFKVEDALKKYELAIRANPRHAQALTHASRMLSNIGGRLPKSERNQKLELYEQAQVYSEKSIELNPADPTAHLAYVISLGLQSEIENNPNEKVRYAQDIHKEATLILQIDSTFAEAYFILGKWHYELARLNWIELMACKLFFGGFPEEISFHKALHYFTLANNYKPDYILFLFGLASAQHELGDTDKAVRTLKKALSLPLAEPDDATRKERCEALLKQINP